MHRLSRHPNAQLPMEKTEIVLLPLALATRRIPAAQETLENRQNRCRVFCADSDYWKGGYAGLPPLDRHG